MPRWLVVGGWLVWCIDAVVVVVSTTITSSICQTSSRVPAFRSPRPCHLSALENERTSGRADEGSTSERERVSRSAVGRDEDTIRTKGHEQDGDRGDRGGDENRARRCLDVADLGERQQRLQGHRHGSRRSHSAVVSFRRERGEANASSDGQSRRCRHARDHRGDRWADK